MRGVSCGARFRFAQQGRPIQGRPSHFLTAPVFPCILLCMSKRKSPKKSSSQLGRIIFAFHLVVVAFWLGLFFVPTSLWKDRVVFHFYFTVFIVTHQFVWGALIWPWTKKFNFPCFLTSIMQLARGYKLSDPRNYNHSFISEGFKNLGIKVSMNVVTALTFVILIINIYQYFTR